MRPIIHPGIQRNQHLTRRFFHKLRRTCCRPVAEERWNVHGFERAITPLFKIIGSIRAQPFLTKHRLEPARLVIYLMPLTAGNTIRFRRGDTFTGEIQLSGIFGTEEYPVTIGSYGSAQTAPKLVAPAPSKPVYSADIAQRLRQTIASAGKTEDTFDDAFDKPADSDIHGVICVTDSEYVVIDGLDAYGDNDGETLYSNQDNPHALVDVRYSNNIQIRNLQLQGNVTGTHKAYYADVSGKIWRSNGKNWLPYQSNAYYGVLVAGAVAATGENKDNVIIENVVADGLTMGISVNADQFTVKNCQILNCANWGISVTGTNGLVTDCSTNHTGFGTNPVGNAAFMVQSSQDVMFEKLTVQDACRGPQTFDGVGFDFEGGSNQRRITLKDSYFYGTDGAAIMLFTNTDGNQDIVVDNVYIENYLRAGASPEEGAISMSVPVSQAGTYKNTATFINVTVMQNGFYPFYTGYADPKKELLEWKGINFINCSFLRGDADHSALQECLNRALRLKKDTLSDYEWEQLQEAIRFAQETHANAKATEEQLQEALEKLQKKMEPFLYQLEEKNDIVTPVPNPTQRQEDRQETDEEESLMEKFRRLLLQADTHVVLRDTFIPVVTQEMLQMLIDNQKGLILQKDDEIGKLLMRFTMDTIEDASADLDLTLLDEAIHQQAMAGALKGSGKALLMAFRAQGKLPGKMQVIMRNTAEYAAAMNPTLYRWNTDTSVLDTVAVVQVSNDGEYLQFTLEEYGEYVLQATGTKKAQKSPSAAETFPWKPVLIGFAALLLAGGAVLCLFLLRKRSRTAQAGEPTCDRKE